MIALRICIDVDDLDRAVHFYNDALGLTPARRLGNDWAEMTGLHVTIDLLAVHPGSPPAPGHSSGRREFHRHWTPVHLDFVVDDLDAAVRRAVAAGATLDRDVQERSYGRMANLADPFGHGFCLLEMNERGYDALLDEPENVA